MLMHGGMDMTASSLARACIATWSSVLSRDSMRLWHREGERRGLRNWLARAAAEAQDSGRFPDV